MKKKWYNDKISEDGIYEKRYNYLYSAGMLVIREASLRGDVHVLDKYNLFQSEQLMRDFFTEHIDVIHLDAVKWLADHGMHFYREDLDQLAKLKRKKIIAFISNHYKHPVGHSIIIPHQDFKIFLSVLKSLIPFTGDLVIRNRRIVQLSKWDEIGFDVDLSPCLDYEGELLFMNIRRTERRLRPLLKGKDSIRLLFDQKNGEDFYTFSTIPGNVPVSSEAYFRKPSLKQLWLRTVHEKTFSMYFFPSPGKTLTSFLIGEEIIERIRAFKKSSASNNIYVSFENGKAMLFAGGKNFGMTFITAPGDEEYDGKSITYRLTWFLLKSTWIQVNIYDSLLHSRVILKLEFEVDGIPYTLWSHKFTDQRYGKIIFRDEIVMEKFPGIGYSEEMLKMIQQNNVNLGLS